MTNKVIFREVVWLAAGLILSYIIALLLTPSSNVYVSDIYIATRPGVDMDNWLGKIISTLTFSVALILYFPVLFLLNSIRGLLNKFSNRPFNVFLMFICFSSMLVSILFALTYEPIATLLAGSWTVYPPLGAVPEFTPPNNLHIWFYSILGFLVLQTLVLLMTARRVFSKQE